MVWHHTLIFLPGLYFRVWEPREAFSMHERHFLVWYTHKQRQRNSLERYYENGCSIRIDSEYLEISSEICHKQNPICSKVNFFVSMFQKEARGEPTWNSWSFTKNSETNIVIIKPHNAGELWEVSLENVETVTFFLFWDGPNLRCRIVNRIHHNSIICLPEFGHLEWKPRVQIQ